MRVVEQKMIDGVRPGGQGQSETHVSLKQKRRRKPQKIMTLLANVHPKSEENIDLVKIPCIIYSSITMGKYNLLWRKQSLTFLQCINRTTMSGKRTNGNTLIASWKTHPTQMHAVR